MLKRIAEKMWGKFDNPDELKKFTLLGVIFWSIIGAYWALRPIKDSIFASIVGVDYQPKAKMLSLLIIVPLVLIYSKLIDKYPRHKVFYALSVIYGCLGLLFAWGLSHPEIGIPNTVEDPSRLIGWGWYVFVESIGSLMVALFWAITVDITPTESAKRGFPIIALSGQLGNLCGPLFLRADKLGFENSAPIVAIAALWMFVIGALMWVFMHVVPKELQQGFKGKDDTAKDKKEEPGFFEGLKLLVTKPYLLGLFLFIFIYEVVVTVFDFQLKSLAKAAYPLEKDMAAFLGEYAVTTGVLSFVCVLLGINSIQRKLGMKASLLLLPALVTVGVFVLRAHPVLNVVFWIMVVAKGVNYALNQPTIKQLYIPTSKDAKYKAQAWIEMFGGRSAKAGGSAINNLRGGFIAENGFASGSAMFLNLSSVISLALIGGWFFVVLFVAKTYTKAIKENKVVC